MPEVKKCPKCGGEMELGQDLTPFSLHSVGASGLGKQMTRSETRLFHFTARTVDS
jgi:hypothetical protein